MAKRESFRSIYRREVDRCLARSAETSIVMDRDLATLPGPLQTYLRRAGVVGRPRPNDVRVLWCGQMRNGQHAPWMDVRVEQMNFFDQAARMFYMQTSRFRLPVEALHVYADGHASMRARVASLVDVVDARGPEMDRSETVTMFNDMCLLAPAALIRAPIEWTLVDRSRVHATFTNAGHRISAELRFDEVGDLVNFISHDRDQSADGKTYRTLPWSTPLRDYRYFGDARLASRGEAVWHEAEGDFVYARLQIVDVAYNLPRGEGTRRANVQNLEQVAYGMH